MDRFTWSTAWKIAWRESRSSAGKFLFVCFAVAAGVGALTGVRGFSTAFRTMLLREARTLMAADLSVRVFEYPTPTQTAAMDSLAARGVERTWVTETVTMVSSEAVRDPLLVSVKAIDPSVYPYYGKIGFEPPGQVSKVLSAGTLAASSDLLMRLKIDVGGAVRLGGQDFRVTAVVVTEPDRMSGSLNVGPRVMMSREGLERTGLLAPGSRAAQRFLFRLAAAAPPVEETRAILRRTFPDARVIDFRETHPLINRGLTRSTMFLSLVSLVALILGAIGVASVMHAHLEQKMDTIAMMKCLGARSSQITSIYLIQTLALGLVGGTAGVLLGLVVQRIFPVLIERYFQIRPTVSWDWTSLAQGLGAGVLTTLLFTVPPLLSIRRVRPSVILRREMAGTRAGWRRRWRQSAPALGAGALILIGVALMAAWLIGGDWDDALEFGSTFVGGLLAGLLVLAIVAWVLLKALRAFLRSSRWRLPASLRHGIANLYRPGNQAQSVLVSLGVGVMFILTVYLVQHSMLEQISNSAPPGMPNVFFVGVTAEQREGLLELTRAQPGILKPPEIVAGVPVRAVSVNGTPSGKIRLRGDQRRFLATRQVTYSATKPPSIEVVQGAWWTDIKAGDARVAIIDEAAKALGLQPGATMEFDASGRKIRATVAAIYRAETVRAGPQFEFIFDPVSLAGLPATYFGGVRMKPAAVPALQRVAYERFPTVSVVNIADVLQIAEEVVDQIALVVRFIAAFAILAGVIILAASVAGTRFRRVREVVILKTLGGTRRRVAAIFSVEFLILGATAGLMGGLLAGGFTTIVMRSFFETEGDRAFRPDWPPLVVAIVLTALIANATGWLASFRILGQKPLEVLRDE